MQVTQHGDGEIECVAAGNSHEGGAILAPFCKGQSRWHFWSESGGPRIEPRAELPSDRACLEQRPRPLHGGVHACLQTDCCVDARDVRGSRHLLGFGEVAAQRPLTVDVLARRQGA